jgi:RES domain-containing protein
MRSSQEPVPELAPEDLEQVTEGIEWGDKKTFPVQAVPSVIIPREMNYLINPAHPHSDELNWGDPEPFRFDPRLVASSRKRPLSRPHHLIT